MKSARNIAEDSSLEETCEQKHNAHKAEDAVLHKILYLFVQINKPYL